MVDLVCRLLPEEDSPEHSPAKASTLHSPPAATAGAASAAAVREVSSSPTCSDASELRGRF